MIQGRIGECAGPAFLLLRVGEFFCRRIFLSANLSVGDFFVGELNELN
jgi:hypothetical protein